MVSHEFAAKDEPHLGPAFRGRGTRATSLWVTFPPIVAEPAFPTLAIFHRAVWHTDEWSGTDGEKTIFPSAALITRTDRLWPRSSSILQRD